MNPLKNQTVLSWVANHYRFGDPVSVELLRAYTNDVYLVTTGQGRFVLKVYGLGWRTTSEVLYEVDLLHHLIAKGILVAAPVTGTDNQAVQFVREEGTERCAVMFSYAAGHKPQPPFSAALYEIEGRSLAALHGATDDFVSTHPRQVLDEEYLLYEPLAFFSPHLPSPDARQFFSAFTEQLAGRIHHYADQGLDWGPCHGDVTLDNFHVSDDGQIVWYDFDSGGPGWRAADLQGWAVLNTEATPRWQAFLRGYREIRALNSVNIEAAPALTAAFEVWGVAVDLQNRVLAEGEEAVGHYLIEAQSRLESWADYLGFVTRAGS